MRGAKFVVLFCAALATASAADILNIKPGLWEVTYKTKAEEFPPPPAATKAERGQRLAKLAPAQRIRAEIAIYEGRPNLAAPTISQRCVTKEELSQGLDFGGGGTCQRPIAKVTSSIQEIRRTCVNGANKSASVTRVLAINPEAWIGTMAVVNSAAMDMSVTIGAKWLGADCGSVKPTDRK